MKHFGFLLVSLMLAAANAQDKVPSQLLGYTFDQTGITFQVAFGGCLDQKSIEFVNTVENDLTKVTMLQNIDRCEMNAPYGIIVKKTYAEMGLTKGGVYEFTNVASPISIYRSSN